MKPVGAEIRDLSMPPFDLPLDFDLDFDEDFAVAAFSFFEVDLPLDFADDVPFRLSKYQNGGDGRMAHLELPWTVFETSGTAGSPPSRH